MSIRQRKYSYILNLLISIDQLLAAICGYNADCTISAMLGEKLVKKKISKIGWSNPLEAIIFRTLEKIDKGHCVRAYHEERNDSLNT